MPPVSNKAKQRLMAEARKYVKLVARYLKTAAPKIKIAAFPQNAIASWPWIKGAYDSTTNTIYIAKMYPFRDVREFKAIIKHEIAEWLSYLVTGKIMHRVVYGHSDSLFRRIYSAVHRYYPKSPEKLAQYVEKISMQEHD